MSIAVLVVTYNQVGPTHAFLTNYFDRFGEGGPFVLILDNNSSDGTVDVVKREFPSVDIRKLNDNYGCVTGRNIGVVALQELGYDMIYISDNDVVFEDPLFFEKLNSFMCDHPDVDGCCPVVRWSDDRTIQTLGTRSRGGFRARNVSKVDTNNRVNTLPGCAQLLRVEAFKRYGLYDNDYSPLSLEDFEWGIRATRQGASLVYTSSVEVVHLHNRSVADDPKKLRHLIEGRTVYLRKQPSVSRLLNEVRFLPSLLKQLGVSYTLESYVGGLRKPLNREPREFQDFISLGLNRFYANPNHD